LVKSGISVITPNPKTSGGARWNYLAGWAYALKKNDNDEAKAKEFIKRLFKNVPVLDTGARGSTTTFIQNGIGDVLLAWENEALLAAEKLAKDKVEIVIPSLTLVAEPPVAVADKVAARHGTQEVAKAYLEYLYSDAGQEIAAKYHYRPSVKAIAEKHAAKFPKVNAVTIDEAFGGWEKAQKVHFADQGTFDQIYQPGKQ
jgi:sulfate/thiosulfate transport system substrate-binding protein